MPVLKDIRILETDGSVVYAQIETDTGSIDVIAELYSMGRI
jgi:hypothetical protein